MVGSDSLRFLKAFARHPMRVGAVAPSSPALARMMVRGLDIQPGQTVIEFGPGTGPFTHALRAILPDPACYLGIERDPPFVQQLRKRFPDLTFVEASAEDALPLAHEHGLDHVKAVICGLPFASLPHAVQDRVIAALDALLEPGSEFRTFQYLHAYMTPHARRYRDRMNELFGKPQRSSPIMLNLPPAYVLTWKR